MSDLSDEKEGLVHWVGEGPTSLHGNGAASFKRGSGDEDEVTCTLCQTLLARGDHLTSPPGQQS